MVRIAAAAIVSLFAFLAAASGAEAQYFGRNKVHYDRLDFRLLQTDHFDIYYYAEEEAATQLAARMAERWYARFSQIHRRCAWESPHRDSVARRPRGLQPKLVA